MKALMFDRLGLPRDVMDLRDVPAPAAGPGEVLVRVLLSPIIPGDALFTQGLYPEPVRPNLPGETAGNYGVGIVEAVGHGASLPLGALVAVTYRGLWAEYAVAPIAKVVLLPKGFRPELGAEFMNLITAWDLLARAAVIRDQWLVVTAGHATVSILLAQFAQAVGVKVLSVVRRRRDGLDLTAFGAAAVLSLEETQDAAEAVRAITDGGVHGLVDCVGGPAFGDLVRALRFGSRAVIYGGFEPEPFRLHNLDLLLNGLEISTYVYRYFFDGPGPSDEALVRQVLALSAYLDIQAPEAGRYALGRFKEALAEAGASPGRRYFAP